MAVYDGFFDAVLDEETGEYDRAYSSGDFTGYFASIIGSGVCIHDNPDSFLVRLEGGKAVVSPGYLFIQGYWLKNDADYTIDLPGTGNYAIVAHLNLGTRMIELEARSVAQAYPDSLVLAIVSPASAEDTRRNTDICGVIDTAGELSQKAEWAVNYIDNEIENKLAAVEQDIAAQERKLDAKIAEVQAVADSIVPPPVGSIKFSASQDVGEEWLRCDGSFINEQDYPELVASLGKLIPSGDKFQLLSSGEIGPQISNGVVYDGRLWVYSYSTKKLYGVDVEGTAAVKEILLASEDGAFADYVTPSSTQPIALSIVPRISGGGAKIFLSQIIVSSGNISTTSIGRASPIRIFTADFSENAGTLELTDAITSVTSSAVCNPANCIPYVTTAFLGGIETWFCCIGGPTGSPNVYYLTWGQSGAATVQSGAVTSSTATTVKVIAGQRYTFSSKNHGELVYMWGIDRESAGFKYSCVTINSIPTGEFYREERRKTAVKTNIGLTVPGPVNIAGQNDLLFEYSTTAFPSIPLDNLTDFWAAAQTDLQLPSAARTFPDAAAYLWGKDIYLIFVGTGIIFSRSLEEGDFGYLDTTGVLGTITQFGYLDYSQDEGTLYIVGQDTTNQVKAAKIVLNTLYDYANDGAWLPMIASDGIPAYIKAKESDTTDTITDPVTLTITVLEPSSSFDLYANVIFNGEVLITGTYTRTVSNSGTFTVGYRTNSQVSNNHTFTVKLNGGTALSESIGSQSAGYEKSVSFKTADYLSGITLQGS